MAKTGGGLDIPAGFVAGAPVTLGGGKVKATIRSVGEGICLIRIDGQQADLRVKWGALTLAPAVK